MRTANIKCSFVRDNKYRFEGKYFLNDNSYMSLPIEQHSDRCVELGKIANVFNPGIFKRQFCKDTPRAVQYFQSSDVNVAEESSTVFVNRKQAENLNLLVKKGDILITGFGTIGNTRIVSRFQDGTCFANNVCRIRSNQQDDRGYLYAFLSSKYGNAQLNKNASGSVVRYIEAPGIKRTLVPIMPDNERERINTLINGSVLCRETAFSFLELAKHSLSDFIGYSYKAKSGIVSGKLSNRQALTSFKTRLDAPIYLHPSVSFVNSLKVPTQKLGSCNLIMWYPGIFKRIYVKSGLPYLQGSSLLESNPFKKCDMLSKSKTPKLDQLWLKEGQLLITCAGSCGDVKLITKEYDEHGAIGSPDIIRMVSKDELFTIEYLFAYLQLDFVHDYIQSFKYGSVIERFDIQNLETLPVVIPSDELSKAITDIIKNYKENMYLAFKKEEEAVNIIETTVDKWITE